MEKRNLKKEKEERDSILGLVTDVLKQEKYFIIVAGKESVGAIISGFSPLEIAQSLSEFFEKEPRIYSSFALAEGLFEVKAKMVRMYGQEEFDNMVRKGIKPKDIKDLMYG